MKRLQHILSVAALLLACKPAWADDAAPSNFWSGFNLAGYASAGIEVPRDAQVSANLNEVSMLLTWNGNSRWSFFGELEYEHPLTWDDDRKLHTKQSHLDLERLYLDYNFSETVNLRMGRFLTPNSRWNLLHAAPLVWTSTRPLATYRLFPQNTNGVMLFGSKPVGELALDYMLFGELLEDQDDDYELSFEHVRGARVALSKGWNIGASLLTFTEQKVAGNAGRSQNYRMLGLDFVRDFGWAEISGEGFARITSSGSDGSSGAYLQAAVPLNGLGLVDWFGIARIENLHREGEDSAERWLVGATWRVKPTQLLKFEFVGGSGDQPEAPRGFLTSFALFF